MVDEITGNENLDENQVVGEEEPSTEEAVEVTNKDLLDALNNLPEALARVLFCYSRPDCHQGDEQGENNPSGEGSSDGQSDLTDDELLTIKNNTMEKITTARLDYEDAINYLKQVLILNNCYSQYDVKLYIGMDRKNDLMLTVKLRPFTYVGKCIQFFYDAFGEPEAFICSNHHMKMIMEYKLV